jgi:hypothetical protein
MAKKPQSKWAPAKTIADAEAFARSIGVKEFEFAGELEIANAVKFISEVFAALMAKRPLDRDVIDLYLRLGGVKP